MGSHADKAPLIVIVGETASGKSDLALQLAQQFDGEIIAADSRTIYRGMDIGTAKPSLKQQQLVPHHLLGIAKPDKPLTAVDFKELAVGAIEEVSRRGKVPFLVGGTGLYIDAVLYDFSFSRKADSALRLKWQGWGVEELQTELLARGIPLPSNERNPRHLIRQLETGGVTDNERQTIRPNTLIIGLYIEREELIERVNRRIDAMFARGLIDEVRRLVDRYSWECPSLQTIGYQEFKSFYDGHQTIDEVQQAIAKNTLSYAKRQRTWFRRNKSVHWIRKKEEAVDVITTFLNK